MIRVTLTKEEYASAAWHGVRRNFYNDLAGRRSSFNRYSAGWSEHVEGALCEMAVAKHLNIFWDNCVHPEPNKRPDVAGLQIRGCRHDGDHLLMHRDDDPNQRFVLVLRKKTDFLIKGWAWGYEGQRDEHWGDLRDGRPCFCVPHAILRPFEGRLVDGLWVEN